MEDSESDSQKYFWDSIKKQCIILDSNSAVKTLVYLIVCTLICKVYVAQFLVVFTWNN